MAKPRADAVPLFARKGPVRYLRRNPTRAEFLDLYRHAKNGVISVTIALDLEALVEGTGVADFNTLCDEEILPGECGATLNGIAFEVAGHLPPAGADDLGAVLVRVTADASDAIAELAAGAPAPAPAPAPEPYDESGADGPYGDAADTERERWLNDPDADPDE